MADVEYTYCLAWNYKLDKQMDPMSEAKAREIAGSTGRAFSVVAWRGDKAFADMRVSPGKGLYQVHFHDDLGRETLYYLFERSAPGELFLAKVVHYDYQNDNPRAMLSDAAMTEVRFGADGIVSNIETDASGEGTKTDYRDVDVSVNYEPEPGFGDWDSIFRRERDRSVSDQPV